MKRGSFLREYRRRRWRGLAVVALIVLALLIFDFGLKRTAKGPGFCPDRARWIVTATDLGRFWSSLEATGAVQRAKDELPNPLAKVELYLRKETGIRPTPIRWRLWLGERFLAAGAPEGAGVCVYPGLLLRGLDWFRRTVFEPPGREGPSTFKDWHYAWREGFLIVSTSQDYVLASLKAAPPAIEPSPSRDEAQFHWLAEREAHVRVRAGEDIPLQGGVQVAVTERAGPLSLADAWPTPPLVGIACSKWEDVVSLFDFLREACWRPVYSAALDPATAVVHQWDLGRLPVEWDRAIDEVALALWDIDTSEVLPAPAVAWVARSPRPLPGPHPLEPLTLTLDVLPYEWQGNTGLVAPILGEKLTLCLGRSGRDWYAATQEPVMAGLVGRLQESPELDADLSLRLDWKRTAEVAEALLNKAGELELVPQKNGEEVKADLTPWVRAVSTLGRVELNGHAESGWLFFEGFLARQTEGEKDDEV